MFHTSPNKTATLYVSRLNLKLKQVKDSVANGLIHGTVTF